MIQTSSRPLYVALAILGTLALFVSAAPAQESSSVAVPEQTTIQGWPGHAHDSQHSGISSVAAQSLNKIHWSVPVDLNPNIQSGELLIHYGSPLITPANTVIVPVKTAANAFRVEAHNGATGALIWSLNTNYQAPAAGFTPPFSPVLQGNNLYIPEGGGTVIVRANPDSATGTTTRVVFYGLANYSANPTAFDQNVQIFPDVEAFVDPTIGSK
jgi:hypothetical protein